MGVGMPGIAHCVSGVTRTVRTESFGVLGVFARAYANRLECCESVVVSVSCGFCVSPGIAIRRSLSRVPWRDGDAREAMLAAAQANGASHPESPKTPRSPRRAKSARRRSVSLQSLPAFALLCAQSGWKLRFVVDLAWLSTQPALRAAVFCVRLPVSHFSPGDRRAEVRPEARALGRHGAAAQALRCAWRGLLLPCQSPPHAKCALAQ